MKTSNIKMGTLKLFTLLLRAMYMLFTTPMYATHTEDNCSEMDRCQTKIEENIRIIFPVPGSQLHMSECRIQYTIENAPSGAASRILVGGEEIDIFWIGGRRTQFFDRYVNETLVLYPGIWDVKVSKFPN